jgi:NADPH:quinone reductase-like Zn-dependent oxidoreductase
MKVAVYRRYGPPGVLQIEDIAKPVPNDDEVLIRVHATTVCAGDVRFRRADPFFLRLLNGIRRPKRIRILGMEFAGTVEKVGTRATRFAEGDRVFGSTGFRFGAYAEYVCVPESNLLAKVPDTVTFEMAAAIPFGGISALHFLTQGKIRPGQSVLIYGASGSVGTFAVQLAKHFGAHVTGVCSTTNLELVKSLGADKVVDYTRSDFSSGGCIYDIIFDTVGYSGFWRSMKSLKRGGCYLLASSVPAGAGIFSLMSGLLSPAMGAIWTSLTGAGRVIGGVGRSKPGDLTFLVALVERGQLKTVIDRRYSLDEIALAHRYVETGRKKGNVVIAVA